MGLIVLSIALALLLGIGMVWLTTRQYPKFQLEGIHWLSVLVCMAVTAFLLVAIIASSRELDLMNRNADTLLTYSGILDDIIPGLKEEDISLSQMAGDVLDNFQHKKKQKLVSVIVFSVVGAVALNAILAIFLQKEGQKATRRRSRRSTSRSSHSAEDNF